MLLCVPSTEEHFPLNKKDIFSASLHICFKDQVLFSCGSNEKNVDAPYGVHYGNGIGGGRILKYLPKNKDTYEQEKITDDSHLKRALNYLFHYTEGRMDQFRMTYDVLEESPEDSKEILKYVTIAIANRPISTTFLIQEGKTPSCPVQVFIREYIDFSMYAANNINLGVYSPLEITEKLLRCEFLYLNCYLSNSEALKDFGGWGLAVFKAKLNKIDFDFFRNAVQDFISVKKVQWRYLAFEMVPPEDEWNSLISKGKPVTFKYGDNKCKEFKLKRADNEKARIGRTEALGQTYVYFYKGKLTEDMKDFNIQFWRGIQ